MTKSVARRVMPLLALLVALTGVASVSAIHEDDAALKHISVGTPPTYDQCIDEVTSDTITISNVRDPVTLETWYLKGWVSVEYVTETGRIPVPGGFYEVDQFGDLELEIFYPPVSEWYVKIDPSTGNVVAEIHVDLSIEVFDVPGGTRLGLLGLGPGHDWDVYCLTPPPPPPPGEDGCTPGFWKNHTSAWTSTGWSPQQTVEAPFNVPDAYGLDQDSLLTALNYGGGPREIGGAKILLRAAVAALLNASNPDVDYPMSATTVIGKVNTALASNDRDSMLTLAGLLDAQNNLGCPIDG